MHTNDTEQKSHLVKDVFQYPNGKVQQCKIIVTFYQLIVIKKSTYLANRSANGEIPEFS